MPVWLAATLVAVDARAQDDPNWAVTVHVAAVHVLGDEHPWGARVGADWQFALGDHCGWNERTCRRGSLWPVAGPAASATWQGGDRLSFELHGELGLANLDMAHVHFALRWEFVARAGLRVDVADPAVGVALGGFAAKSLGMTVRTGPNSTTVLGTHFIGLRIDADTAFLSKGTWTPPTFGGGLWIAPLGTMEWD